MNFIKSSEKGILFLVLLFSKLTAFAAVDFQLILNLPESSEMQALNTISADGRYFILGCGTYRLSRRSDIEMCGNFEESQAADLKIYDLTKNPLILNRELVLAPSSFALVDSKMLAAYLPRGLEDLDIPKIPFFLPVEEIDLATGHRRKFADLPENSFCISVRVVDQQLICALQRVSVVNEDLSFASSFLVFDLMTGKMISEISVSAAANFMSIVGIFNKDIFIGDRENLGGGLSSSPASYVYFPKYKSFEFLDKNCKWRKKQVLQLDTERHLIEIETSCRMDPFVRQLRLYQRGVLSSVHEVPFEGKLLGALDSRNLLFLKDSSNRRSLLLFNLETLRESDPLQKDLNGLPVFWQSVSKTLHFSKAGQLLSFHVPSQTLSSNLLPLNYSLREGVSSEFSVLANRGLPIFLEEVGFKGHFLQHDFKSFRIFPEENEDFGPIALTSISPDGKKAVVGQVKHDDGSVSFYLLTEK